MKSIPKINVDFSENEYHVLCYCWENVGKPELIEKWLSLTGNEIDKIMDKLEKLGLVEKGKFILAEENKYNYYITNKGEDVAKVAGKKYDYIKDF